MRATVKQTRQVAEGTLLVVLDLDGEHWDYRPGQYFWVEIPNPPFKDEKGPRRHISIVTSPTERGVIGFCTRLRDSAFKQALRELEVGSELEIEPPKGNYALPDETDRPFVFVAGGIGITVFRSMLRYVADEGTGHRVTLLYSNRDRAGAAFLDELARLEQELPNLRVVLTMTQDPGWEGETRRIAEPFLRDHVGEELSDSTFLVAGPPDMVEGVVETLATAGVPEEQILPSRFAGY